MKNTATPYGKRLKAFYLRSEIRRPTSANLFTVILEVLAIAFMQEKEYKEAKLLASTDIMIFLCSKH